MENDLKEAIVELTIATTNLVGIEAKHVVLPRSTAEWILEHLRQEVVKINEKRHEEWVKEMEMLVNYGCMGMEREVEE